MSELTKAELEDNRDGIQLALDAAREAQPAFWEALGDLEFELGGAELDSTEDLEGVTVDHLIEEYSTDKAEA